MKIPLVQIASLPRELVFSEVVQFANHGLVRLVSPVDVRMVCFRSGDDLFFDGTLSFEIETICSRCLKEHRSSLEKNFDFVLTPDTLPTNKNRELNQDELDLSFYSEEDIDLSLFVHEQTLLGIPIRALCNDDCMGLCPGCGVDRNEVECNCGVSSGDPRMGVFRNLRVKC